MKSIRKIAHFILARIGMVTVYLLAIKKDAVDYTLTYSVVNYSTGIVMQKRATKSVLSALHMKNLKNYMI